MVRLRVNISDCSAGVLTPSLETFRRIAREELELSANQPRPSPTFRDKSYKFVVLSWFASTGTILHLIYGTLTFSSVLFISTRDALGVVGRYLASTFICRVILMFGIGGMRTATQEQREQSEVPGLCSFSEDRYVRHKLCRREVRKVQTAPTALGPMVRLQA